MGPRAYYIDKIAKIEVAKIKGLLYLWNIGPRRYMARQHFYFVPCHLENTAFFACTYKRYENFSLSVYAKEQNYDLRLKVSVQVSPIHKYMWI